MYVVLSWFRFGAAAPVQKVDVVVKSTVSPQTPAPDVTKANSDVGVKVDQVFVKVFNYSRVHVIAQPVTAIVFVAAVVGLITIGLDKTGILNV